MFQLFFFFFLSHSFNIFRLALNLQRSFCFSPLRAGVIGECQALRLISILIKGMLLCYRPNRRSIGKFEVISHFQDPELSEALFPSLAVSDHSLMQKQPSTCFKSPYCAVFKTVLKLFLPLSFQSPCD